MMSYFDVATPYDLLAPCEENMTGTGEFSLPKVSVV